MLYKTVSPVTHTMVAQAYCLHAHANEMCTMCVSCKVKIEKLNWFADTPMQTQNRSRLTIIWFAPLLPIFFLISSDHRTHIGQF